MDSDVGRYNFNDCLRNMRSVNQAAVGNLQRGRDLSQPAAKQKEACVRIPSEHDIRNIRRADYDRLGNGEDRNQSCCARVKPARSQRSHCDNEKVRIFEGDESHRERPAATVHRIQPKGDERDGVCENKREDNEPDLPENKPD